MNRSTPAALHPALQPPASVVRDGPTPADPAAPAYTRTAVVLHWLVGAALLAEIGYGVFLRQIARGTPSRGPAVNLHKSIGLAIGIAIVVRLAWRLTHRPPPLPPRVERWQATAARVNHAAMYACMVAIPLAGYAASNFSKYGVRFMGLVFAPWGPDMPAVYDALNTLHDAAAYLLTALIVVHVAATLKHAWVDHDRPFERLRWRRQARRPPRPLPD